jgi:dimethylaniline monooxygenase (N-oxide forming)
VDPTIQLTVLEAEDSVGGTWSRRRIYPTLQAQQTYGVYEFGDFPVDTAGVENPEMSFVTAERLHANIAAYAERFGITDKIRFGTRVRRLERAGAGWAVWIHGEAAPLAFDKVVVATGLTSNPSLPGLDTAELLTSAEVETVTLYGGGKSAVDAMHLCVKHGKHVNWVVRSDAKGNGASLWAPGIFRGTNSNDILSTRLTAKLHPSLDAPRGWWYWFLHAGSGIGSWLLWTYWGWITRALMADSGYGTSENIIKLQPKKPDHA